MSGQVKAIDVVDPVVYNDTVEAVEALAEKWEQDPEAAMSIYLSLKVVVKILEEELGIQPVEITVEKESTDAA